MARSLSCSCSRQPRLTGCRGHRPARGVSHVVVVWRLGPEAATEVARRAGAGEATAVSGKVGKCRHRQWAQPHLQGRGTWGYHLVEANRQWAGTPGGRPQCCGHVANLSVLSGTPRLRPNPLLPGLGCLLRLVRQCRLGWTGQILCLPGVQWGCQQEYGESGVRRPVGPEWVVGMDE